MMLALLNKLLNAKIHYLRIDPLLDFEYTSARVLLN